MFLKGHVGEQMVIEAKILKAISETMQCNKCPCVCKAREKSSQANCVMHWCEILSKIDPDTDWKEVRFMVARNEIT